MSSSSRGQGVRKFWEARASGGEVDVKAIFDEHPDEALELADAIRKAASQEDSAAQERMWLARAQVLNRFGEDVTLGALLRTSREEEGLSTSALSLRVQGRGVRLLATAIEQLEADRTRITNVKTPHLWSTLAEILKIDRHRLVATIQVALSVPHTAQRFTRMERGATAANRKQLLTSELPSAEGEDATSYIDWVRADLGLPHSPSDAIQ
jgi:hypothetical protein